MLQIRDIRKQYVTGDLTQTALDGVSLNLRDNEFVAILGPSGSGKTTLLNVIGGLDRYDSGDLIINGISTRKYTDRDWDSYRNHTIGFVFQSYNLIPHQSVLANVELALTISGISPSERKKRAKKALEDVGLGNQLHKRPNQMSGGQMQRVAIARALVNNPDILLADEPTGALDSETSVQIMDLLKEVARDRLVVMVTHNPELAEEYANRIVRVKDGRIIGDTNPFEVDVEALTPPEHKNMGKASMSFWTALSLSFNNLRTKKARTLLTAFAGSIGIIGIALIMSLSTGFQKYIDKIQADTLSNYPLTLQSDTADMGSAMAAFGASIAQSQEAQAGTLVEQQMISQMFAQIGSNDLGSFKAYLEEHYEEIGHTVNTIKYSYGIKPRIYNADTGDGILQANPATIFNKIMGNSMMASYMASDIFQEMVGNMELLDSQYEVLRGRWPEEYNELVVVLSDPNQLSDYMAYTLGLKDPNLLEELMEAVMAGQEVTEAPEVMEWTYDDLMGLQFKLVPVSELYQYNAEYKVWEDMSEDEAFMKARIAEGEDLRIVGIVCAREDVSASALTAGVAYLPELTRHVIDAAAQSKIVRDQLADESINVFTGSPFGEKTESELDFQDMISVDEGAISSAFGMNMTEKDIMNMLEGYIREISKSLQVDTTPARNDFTNTLFDLGSEMLREFIRENGDASGVARIRLTDAESMVDEYLATAGAGEKIKGLADRYALPEDGFRQVYRPLLMGLVTNTVASEISGESLSSASAPSDAAPAAEVTEPETEPAVPETETTDPATEPAPAPEEETSPSETETQPPAEETEPAPTEAPEDPTTPSEEPEPPTDPSDPPEEPTIPPEEPTIPPEEPTIPPEELPEVDIDIDQFYAELSVGDVENAVSQFMNTSAVRNTASVMGTTMMETTYQGILMSKISEFGDRLARFIGNSFTVDGDKIASAFQFNMNEEELQRLMMAMSGQNQEQSALANLRTLGYADLAEPTMISVYLLDFAAKEEFMAFLDAYNDSWMEKEREEYVIRYADVTGIMMSSVRTIIDSVSYALIAFVAVSLVVSSIMIGIITYISVMERTKEIGVLRAIGASKRNITQVFNAETFIIGLCSGLIGIGITLLILIPGNALIHHLTNNPDIVAQLPVANAVTLIVLSMVLTLIGGLIPSKKAAKKDPVIALRSE